ncbi:ribonuclease H-like protein [Melanogaster broomeanus]|nr:ribonuclease H-like protein [Melanogaster broomeanus]
MFSTLGHFQSLPCPFKSDCNRPVCLFSHAHDLPQQPLVIATAADPKPQATTTVTPSTSSAHNPNPTVPIKRPFELTAQSASTSRNASLSEPPPQRLRTATSQKPVALPTQSQTSTAVPVLRVNAAQSQVALPVRQAMLKSLYDHFVILYESILPTNPTLASEHSLRQEEEVYKKSTKLTYRNAVINSIASLKRRPIPTSASHPSVGTEDQITARIEAQKKFDELRLTRSVLTNLLMTTDTMQQWGYILEIPEGEGASKPNALGQVTKCDRCGQSYMICSSPTQDECTYHWGKPFSRTINGEKLRVYSCCSKTTGEDGCSKGFHVFYESDPKDLHARQAFSLTRPPNSADGGNPVDTALDVVALDCEMIYTTGGMQVARVSVVDGSGTEIFDELVRMDDGVAVIDYNTRFSGITQEEHQKASLSLPSIRRSLDAFINSETIVIGHALENDLKTLRMIHYQCVDTAILFPHRAGLPYRRSLRDLVKEHLGISIQTGGGSTGHSSVEDSVATLNLVRWYILNKVKNTTASS